MTVEERRAIRESLHQATGIFTLTGLTLVCPACLSNEWLDGGSAPLCVPRKYTPHGKEAYHFACPDCGLMTFADFLLWDLCACLPTGPPAWN